MRWIVSCDELDESKMYLVVAVQSKNGEPFLAASGHVANALWIKNNWRPNSYMVLEIPDPSDGLAAVKKRWDEKSIAKL